MFVMCVAVTIFLVVFVLPRFAGIYEAKNAVLPAPTRLLMAINSIVTNNSMSLLGGAVIGIAVLMFGSKTARGKAYIDWLKLNIPVVGSTTRALYLTRSARTIATLIDSGISLLDIIGSVRQIVSNRFYTELWDKADDDLRAGRQLSDTFYQSSLIPGPISQMVESGEKAGRLGAVFNRIADFAQSEFDNSVKTTLKFIEPVMIVFIGGIIGFIAISLLLPIFSAATVMTKN
jgi:type IV pilus assembly protein PilC